MTQRDWLLWFGFFLGGGHEVQFREKEACGEGRMQEGREAERGLLCDCVELQVIVTTCEL